MGAVSSVLFNSTHNLEQPIYTFPEHVPLVGMVGIPAREILACVRATDAKVRGVAFAPEVIQLLENRILPGVDVSFQLLEIVSVVHAPIQQRVYGELTQDDQGAYDNAPLVCVSRLPELVND